MADVKFACPHCGQSLEAPVEMIGQTTDCPTCSKSLIVALPKVAAQPRPQLAHKATIHQPAKPARPRSRTRAIVASAITILVLAVSSCLLFGFFLNQKAQAKRSLSAYLRATFANDAKRAYELISSPDRTIKTQTEYAHELADNPFGDVLAKRVSFTIDSVAISEKEATAYVTITAPDMETIMGDLMSDAFAAAFGDDEAERKKLQEKMKAKLEAPDLPTKRENEVFRLVHEDSGWRVFLDWVKEKREREDRVKVQELLAQAESLKKDKKVYESVGVYQQVLKLDNSSYAAQNGIEEAKRELSTMKAKQDYIRSNVELYDFVAAHYDSLLDGKVPGVNFKIKNKGNRTIKKLEVTVYFKDRQGKVISEETYYPVNTSSWSFDSNGPLKPNYIWQMERGKFYSAKNVPDEWQEGNALVEITDLELDTEKDE